MFPEQNRLRKASTLISVFRGLNKTENTGFSRISENNPSIFAEFKDMKNMCSDDFPQLSTRKHRLKRRIDGIVSNLLIANGKMIFVKNNGVIFCGGEETEIDGFVSGRHDLTQYGNYVIIMPEKLRFHLGTNEISNLEFVHQSETVSSTELNVALYNGGNVPREVIYFRDFSIQKCSLDDLGRPVRMNYIYEKARNMDNPGRQTNVPGDEECEDWQKTGTGYYNHWGSIRVGQTIEAQGESPSGLYRCYQVDGKKEYEGNPTYAKLRRFVKLENYYVKISRMNDNDLTPFAGLKAGDYVTISGMRHSVVDPLPISETINWSTTDWGNYLKVLNGNTFRVYYADDTCIVIKADIEKSVPYNGPMTISRKLPELDSGMMLELNNRLWSCNSSDSNIYASKLGDASNWMAYGDGIASDSYYATVGNEGDFTGIARRNGDILFFKENWIVKVYGTKPSNFVVESYNVLGVEKGSEKSVVWINGVLYYLSHMGVCQYSVGGQPVVISRPAFGNKKYKNAVGGRHRNKYFVSAQNESGTYELFVFDTDSGMWHKEDNTQMMDTATYNNVLYFVDNQGNLTAADAENTLIDSTAEKEQYFEWAVETGNLYGDDFSKKYISKIQIGIKADDMTYGKIYAQFENDGNWHELRRLHHLRRQHSLIPVPVRRADYLRIRIEGKGDCLIQGILIEFTKGSSKVWQF